MNINTHLFYICDYGNDHIQVFDRMFQFLFMFSLCYVESLFFKKRFMSLNLRAVHLTYILFKGKFLSSVGKGGDGEFEFKDPRCCCFHRMEENLYLRIW